MRRWVAKVTYRTANGPLVVEHDLEEIEDLHDLVELGPDWDTIIHIDIDRADPKEPLLTVEQAAQQ